MQAYQFRPLHQKYSQHDADIIGREIVSLGLVNSDWKDTQAPQRLVEVARDPSSPLYRFFTWDDTEAGRRYRLMEAQHLLRYVQVESSISTPHVTFTRQNKYVTVEPSKHPKPQCAPGSKAPRGARSLPKPQAARRSLLRWAKEYGDLRGHPDFAAFEEVFRAIDEIATERQPTALYRAA